MLYYTGVAEHTGGTITNKTHFCCEKLNSYEHLQILWGQVPSLPPGSAAYGCIYIGLLFPNGLKFCQYEKLLHPIQLHN